MNYSNIYWKERLLNYSTSIALGKINITDDKIESIVNFIDNDVDSIHYILIIAILCSFLKILIELDNYYIKEVMNIFINKPQYTFIISIIFSGYITKLFPFVPTYFLTNYIIFSIILFYRLSE